MSNLNCKSYNKHVHRSQSYILIVLLSLAILAYGNKVDEIVIRGIIDNGIGNNLVVKLKQASKQDTLYLYIKSCGGTVAEGAKIIEAMLMTEARVIVEVVDYVESIAAVIILFADQIYIRPDAIVMYHLPRTSAGIITYIDSADPHHSMMANMVIEWIKRKEEVLSKTQWSRFMAGEDVFISGDTLISRIAEAKKSLPITGERYEPWRIIRCNPDYRNTS
jgi:ATP-dependent protease ClpP protease subunit